MHALWRDRPRIAVPPGNRILNPEFTGGLNDAVPTNWTEASNHAGMTRSLRYGQGPRGVRFVDIGFSGTPGGARTYIFGNDGNIAKRIPCADTQVWEWSLWLALAGGSLTNLTSIDISADVYTAVPGYLSTIGAAITPAQIPPGGYQAKRIASALTVSGATAATMNPYLVARFAAAVATDCTFRIYMPGMRRVG